MLKKTAINTAPLEPLERFRLSLSTTGLLVATLFFATSLSPSLVPRPFMMQALLSGVALAAGYAVGVFLHWLWHYMELPELRDRVPPCVSTSSHTLLV